MSSTNRGYDRHKSDYYITPVNEIIKFLNASNLIISKDTIILDPCCGGDSSNTPSYPKAIKSYFGGEINIITNDIRPDSISDTKEDYLNMKLEYTPNIIITNPPFNIATDIIKKAIEDVGDNGIVIMLLRLNYFGSKDRNKWLLKNMPYSCYIHSKRMSFTQDGKADSIEYAHFVWIKGENNNYTKTYLLEYE